MSKTMRLAVILILLGPFLARAGSKQANENDLTLPITIKLATLAPKDSPWHTILQEMAANWAKASDGKIKLKIYPGGVAGDEGDMVRKIRIGQLQAAAVTNAGLSHIATEVTVMTIPMAIDSWEALDRVRNVMASRLESLLAERGFIVLNWGDAGWVRFFVPVKSASVGIVQDKSKLMVWAGNDYTNGIWKSAGFHVVPLAATDVLTGLQTGMVNAFNTTPIMALASQWFPFAEAMIEMPWAPLIGATVMDKKTWDKIPASYRVELKEIAEDAGKQMQQQIRKLEADAISAMQERGLEVITPTPQQRRQWRALMKSVYPSIRGSLVPESWFDEALQAATQEPDTNGH